MSTLLISEKNAVQTVSLNRPEVRNALSAEMIRELTDLFKKNSSRQDLRAIRLKGEGKAFCAGADLSYMQEMINFDFQKNQSESLLLHDMFETIFNCPVPVVAQVHGAVFGGALGLCAVSDIVIADENTQFCFSEVRLGLAPAVISDFVLRKSALGLVAPWMVTGQVFSVLEAGRMGLAHFLAESHELEKMTEKIVTGFGECGPEALRETKVLIQNMNHLSREEARAETAKVISERRVSAEGQEGLKSFLEKRKPSWRLS